MSGFLITFEGGEGSGKTTQIARLRRRIEALGAEVFVTREPGGTQLGSELRRYLVTEGGDPPCPLAELLLYAADRAQHVEKKIVPALRDGKVILCDRYVDATLAYQGYGRQLSHELIRQLNRIATGGLMPDRTIWIDLDPEEGVRRSLERQTDEGVVVEARFEHEEALFHRRVREGYAALHADQPERFRRVEGSGTEEEVAERVWAELSDLFGGAR
jgi:dTMP kinase